MDLATDDRMDPVLEVSIDDSSSPVIIELVGALDHGTKAGLSSRIDQPLSERFREFTMDLDGAIVDASGAWALVVGQRPVRESGGTMLRKEFGWLRSKTNPVNEPAIVGSDAGRRA